MNEFRENGIVVRYIKHKSLLAAVAKALNYVVLYPPANFNTQLVKAEFEGGIYHIKLIRDDYDG